MRILVTTPLAGALAALSLTSFAVAGAATQTHVLRFATAEEVSTLNPVKNTQTVVSYLTQMTGAYCFHVDRNGRLTPELALEVPTQQNGGVSADGTTIVLHFRKHVTWSDGKPFDADDFVFTVAAINNPANIIPSRQGFERIVRIDEPDKFTAIVHLKSPYGAIVPTLFSTAAGGAILPKHLLGSLPNMNDADFNALPVGIGPFRYVTWKRGDRIELERNPSYWRGRPALDRVIMKIVPDRNTVLTQLQTGELDMWYPFGGAFFARVAAIPGVRVIRRPGYAVNMLMLNLKGPVLADRSVRLALRFGLDRRAIRDKIGHGIGALQDDLLPAADTSAPKDIPFTEYDAAKGNALLDAAGWKRGSDGIRSKNGTRLSLSVATTAGAPDADSLVEFMRSNWAALGIELAVQRYQSSILFGAIDQGGILETGKFDMAVMARTSSVPNTIPSDFSCGGRPPAAQNVGGYCNPRFDAIADEYERTYGDAARSRILGRAMRLLADDVPAIALSGPEALFGVKDSLRNFDPVVAAPFADMMKVDI